jgi:uncharacterized protein YbjQ (UPF0145 family)
MKSATLLSGALALGIFLGEPALAETPPTFIVNNEAVGVPVFPHDITDRPFVAVGEVTAGVRKATIFSKEASQEKIYKELWERARKLGADAVVNATYGDSHVTAFSWGKTNATGTAIKFRPWAADQAEGTAPAAREADPGS